MIDLKGKVALVTGGAQGLGSEFAVQLAKAGATVVAADLRDATATTSRIENAGGAAWSAVIDICDSEGIASLVDQILRREGGIDILVNSAAIAVDLAMKPFLDISRAEWDRVLGVNAGGTFECIKAVAPHMMSRRSGKIVNIASTTYMKGAPRMMHYVASKGAVVGITRVAARELGEFEICVNCIAPGLTLTEAVKEKGDFAGMASAAAISSRAIKREQVPTDLVGAVLFLSSPLSDFVTGQTLVVDGGGFLL